MASDQVEYCGDCKFYETCKKLDKEGKLTRCKVESCTKE